MFNAQIFLPEIYSKYSFSPRQVKNSNVIIKLIEWEDWLLASSLLQRFIFQANECTTLVVD